MFRSFFSISLLLVGLGTSLNAQTTHKIYNCVGFSREDGITGTLSFALVDAGTPAGYFQALTEESDGTYSVNLKSGPTLTITIELTNGNSYNFFNRNFEKVGEAGQVFYRVSVPDRLLRDIRSGHKVNILYAKKQGYGISVFNQTRCRVDRAD